jgi:tripartite ATP-independent transporter DctP family solute receptor
MLRNKWVGLLVCLVLITVSLIGCSKPVSQPEEKSVTLKLGHTAAPDHHYQIAAEKFAQLVEQKTNGTVKVQVYPSDQLGSQNESVEGAQLGTQDMVLTSDVLLSSFEPKMGLLNLPFLFRDYDHVVSVLNGPIGQQLSDALSDKGLVVLGFWQNGFRHITNSRGPINKPEDLRGLKIRVPSGTVFVDTFNMLGAISTPMSFGELYSALQLKTVDAQENPITHVLTQKFFEVQDYLSLTYHIHVSQPLIISKIVYERLSENQRKALREAAQEVAVWHFEHVKSIEDSEIEKIKAQGMQVNTADQEAFRTAVKPVYDKHEPAFGKDIIDAIRNSK